MKIVILSAFLSPQRSGAEAMVEEVAGRLSEQYEITVITGRYDRTQKKNDLLGKSVHVCRVGLGLPIDKWLFPFFAPFAARRVRPDIVHAVLESYAGFALVLCRFVMPRAKRVLTLQSTNTSLLLGPIHRAADRITAISTVLIERAKQFTKTPVTLIPNGIDAESIRTACAAHPKDADCVLFVGRLEPMKGVDTLLVAFKDAVLGLSPSIHLRIVGDGSQMAALKKLARDLEIDHRCTFVGKLSPIAVLDEFARAEIFCGLSRSEAMGNVFLEAEAAGCAVLATHTGGISEIVHNGISGMLVPVDDTEAAMIALRSLLKDPELRARLARGGKEAASRYGWDAIAKRYAQVYAEKEYLTKIEK